MSSQTQAPEVFLRVKDIAALLGIKPKTLIEYRCKNRLTLPLEKKDRMLGCKASVFNAWMNKEQAV